MKNKDWRKFLIGNVFNPKSTNSGIDKNKLININGDIPYVTRSNVNNGYSLFIGKQSSKYSFETSNVITIGLDTQTVFYQNFKFYTGQNIQILEFDNINIYSSLFIIPLLHIQMQKFSWGGNGATLGRLNKTNLLLPINSNDSPDYKFMEEYSRNLYEKKEKIYINYIKKRVDILNNISRPVSLENKEWGTFFINEVSDILSGKDIYEKERTNGIIPYVSATSNNNGVGYFVGNTNNTIEKDCISVNRNGSVGYSFYHPYMALFSNDCRKLRLKKTSKYIGLFISNQITLQKEKYGYGYKMGTGRLLKQKILLPIKSDGSPDYEYMEQYIKYKEYQKLNEYLSLKTNEKILKQ